MRRNDDLQGQNVRIVKKGGCGTFILGMFLGFVFTLGALAGAGFWAYKNLSIDKLESIINRNIDVPDSLSGLTIEKLAEFGIEVAGDPSNYSLKSLAASFEFPLPTRFDINENDSIDLASILNTIYDCPLDSLLTTGIANLKNSLTIGNIKNIANQVVSLPNLGLFTKYSNTNLLNIYSIYDTITVEDCIPRKTVNGELVPLTGVIGALSSYRIKDLVATNGIQDAIYDLRVDQVYTFAGNETGIVASIKTLKISELVNNESLMNALGTKTIGELMGMTDEAGLAGVIKNWTINDIRTKTALDLKINDIKLSQVITISGTTGFLAQIANWKLSQITESNILGLKVGDVLSITQTTGILGAIKDLTISNLSNQETLNAKIQTLKISDVLPSATVYTPGTILYALKDAQIGSISSEIDGLRLSEIIPAGEGGQYTGFMSYLIDPANDKDPLLTELDAKIEEAIDEYVVDYVDELTVGELIEMGLIVDNGYSEENKQKTAIELIQTALDGLGS